MFWKVQVWVQGGMASAWSTTARCSRGPLKPEDWKGKWIGRDGGESGAVRRYSVPNRVRELAAAVVTRCETLRGRFWGLKDAAVDHGLSRKPILLEHRGRRAPQEQESSLSSLLHQAILMMQGAEHRSLHKAVTGWQLVSVAA